MTLYWGWVICLCFLILFTLSAGVAFSFTEILVPLSKDFDARLSILAWLGSLPSSLPMLLAPMATVLYYKIGTRATVYIGVIITSAALALTTITNRIVLMFLIYGVSGGVGITLIVNPPFFLLDEYFPYHHPRHVLATSIIACAFPLATLVFNPLTYFLIDQIDWRPTYLVLSISMFVIGSLTAATFKSRADISQSCNDKMGQEPDCYEEILPSDITLHNRTKIVMGFIWFFASACKSIGYYTPFLTLVKQMISLGIPQAKASIAMAVFGAVELISRAVTSYVGDYFKGKILYAYVAFTMCLGVVNVAGAFANSFTHMVLYGIALGTLGGPVIAAMYSSCSEVLFGESVPALFTIFRVGLGCGSIVGAICAGAIFDSTGTFFDVYFLTSTVYFLASASYAVIILLNKYQPTCFYPQMKASELFDMSMDEVTNDTISQKYDKRRQNNNSQNGDITKSSINKRR